MKRVTRWSPDTCDCVLEFEWDDAVVESTRVHVFKNTIKTCPDHPALIGNSLYDQVLFENTCKNITFVEIQKVLPAVEVENYIWAFDGNRVLQVSLVGIVLLAAEKQGIQTALDNKFGAGKAKVT